MPLKPFILILFAVIGLAALTVASVVTLMGGMTNPSIAVLAGVSVVALIASVLVRRFGPGDSDP